MSTDIFAYDSHVHTIYSGHSHDDVTVDAIHQKQREVGLSRIAITEHIFVPKDIKRIQKIAEELPDDPNVVLGAEIDADASRLDGTLVSPTDGLDWVIASFHKFPGTDIWWHDGSFRESKDEQTIYAKWLEWGHKTISTARPNALAHPGALISQLSMVQAFEGPVLDDFREIMESCREYQVAVELNEGMSNKTNPQQRATYYRLFELAKQAGVKIVLGSDAHSLAQIGRYVFVKEIAEKVGLQMSDCIVPEREIQDYTGALAKI